MSAERQVQPQIKCCALLGIDKCSGDSKKELIEALVIPTGFPCTKWCAIGNHAPDEEAWQLANLTMDGLEHQQEKGCLASFEGPLRHDLLAKSQWTDRFGTAEAPRGNWQYAISDGCLSHVVSPDPADDGRPMQKGFMVVANFNVDLLRMRCREGLLSPEARSRVMEEDAFANAAAPAVAMADKTYEPAVTSKMASGGGSAFVLAPGEITGVETGTPLSPSERVAIAKRIRKLKIESDKKWDRCARTKSYDEVLTPLTCYQFVESHVDVSVDPRRNEEHRRSILSVLGIEPRHESLKHLSEKDIEAVSDLFWRKAAAFHSGTGPRTCLTAFLNDTIVASAPVRGFPIRARGHEAKLVQRLLEAETAEGFYVRGASPWGSYCFLTRPTPSGRKQRIVVDYRKINRNVIRAIYYIRRCDDVKSSLVGSIFLSGFDGLKGFNLMKNTKFSQMVWAVLSDIGCLLPQALQLGGTNGSFDFQYVVDVTFLPEGNRVRRFGNLWLNYLDDFAVRSGRWFRGGPLTDAAYDRLLADAKPQSDRRDPSGTHSTRRASLRSQSSGATPPLR